MVNLTPGFHTFNGGEWSKRMWGRVDLAKYLNAARRCENFIPLVQGPLTKRPGFKFVAPLASGASAVRLVPFVFSDSDALVLEFTAAAEGGGGRIRFYRGEGLLLEPWQPLQAVSQAPVASASCSAHGYATGDEVYLRGAAGMTPLNGRRSVIAVEGSDAFALTEIDSSGFPAFLGGGQVARVHSQAHDYGAAELAQLKWVQSLDVLYLFCPGRRVRTLSRTSADGLAWTLADASFADGPYLAENTTQTELTVTHAGGNATLAFSATAGINGGAGFAAPADLGRLVRWLSKSGSAGSEKFAWAVGRITAVGSTTQVTVERLVAQASTAVARDKKAWRLGAWSDARGWPTCGAFYKGRLWVGQTQSHPETVWGSAIDGYQNFAPTLIEHSEREGALPLPTAADALSLTAGGEEASQIRWLAPVAALAVGTNGGEKTIRGSSTAEAVTAENAAILPASTVGVADLPPARVDGTVLFVSRDRRRLHELTYELQADGYVAPEMTLLAGHLGDESPLAEIVFQRRPWRILWARREDGLLLGFTYDRAQEVTAWHRHRPGGEGRVIALASVPAEREDRLWAVVERGTGADVRRSVEFLAADGSVKASVTAGDSFHVDCGVERDLTLEDPAGSETCGLLHHLEGQSVAILADGAVHPPRTVAKGQVTLDRKVRHLAIGLPYAARYESLNLEPALGGGSSLGRPKTLTGVDLFVVDTLGGRVGPDEAALEPLLARRDGQAMDQAPPLLTGVQRLEWRGGWRREKRVVFVHDQPLPCTLAGMVPQLAINEG